MSLAVLVLKKDFFLTNVGSSVEVRTLLVSMSIPFNYIHLHTLGLAHILKADQTQVSKMLFSHAILISIPMDNFSRAIVS